MYIQRGAEVLASWDGTVRHPRTGSSQWNAEVGIVLWCLAIKRRCLGAALATGYAHVGGRANVLL
jgi:hypothetical protein